MFYFACCCNPWNEGHSSFDVFFFVGFLLNLSNILLQYRAFEDKLRSMYKFISCFTRHVLRVTFLTGFEIPCPSSYVCVEFFVLCPCFECLSSAEANTVNNIFNSNIICDPRVTCMQVVTLTKQLQRRFSWVQGDFISTKSREYIFISSYLHCAISTHK